MSPHRFVIALIWMSAASAGVEPAAAQAETSGGGVRAERPEASPAATRKAAGGATLRCWQYGRLIFEEAVSTIPASLAAQTHVFEGRAAGSPVQFIDTQSATCMVK